MKLAASLVQQAVQADPGGDNLKAQLSHVAYTLATAAMPQEQLGALEHAKRLVTKQAMIRLRRLPIVLTLIHTYVYIACIGAG